MLAKLSSKVTDGEIVPFYAEYMDTPKVSSPEFCTEDACFVYRSGGEGDRKLPALRQIDKASENNIYIYIARTLSGPVLKVPRIR